MTQCKPFFYRAALEDSSRLQISTPLISSLCLFSHALCLSVCCWQWMVTTGWIFNSFVSGSTMGGRIVVNIITYRSLRLHFPRPCQRGAITHSSQTHHQHTDTHLPFSCLAVTVPVYTISLCSCVMTPFNPPCILLGYNLVFPFSESA